MEFKRIHKDYYMATDDESLGCVSATYCYVVRKNQRGVWLAIDSLEGVVIGRCDTQLQAMKVCERDLHYTITRDHMYEIHELVPEGPDSWCEGL